MLAIVNRTSKNRKSRRLRSYPLNLEQVMLFRDERKKNHPVDGFGEVARLHESLILRTLID